MGRPKSRRNPPNAEGLLGMKPTTLYSRILALGLRRTPA